MKSLLVKLSLAMAACGFVVAGPALAQDKYPSRPIRIIVTFAPGGTADALARIVAKEMTVTMGQSVVVENRPGASGLIGTEAFAKSAPDGYTLGVMSVSQIALPFAMKSMSYDTKALRPITLIGRVPGLLSVNANLPFKTLQDILDTARAKPGQLSYGNAGNLTASHLTMEMLKLRAHVDIVNVAYKGGGPALLDLASGQVQMSISGPTAHLPFIKSGKLRPIATTALERSTAVPDVPTFAESGLPGFELSDWYGLFAPAGTPTAILDEVQRNVALALAKPDVREMLVTLGAEPGGQSPQAFAKFVSDDMDKIGKLVTELNIKVN